MKFCSKKACFLFICLEMSSFFVLIRSNILLKFIISCGIKVDNRLMNKVESRAKP